MVYVKILSSFKKKEANYSEANYSEASFINSENLYVTAMRLQILVIINSCNWRACRAL